MLCGAHRRSGQGDELQGEEEQAAAAAGSTAAVACWAAELIELPTGAALLFKCQDIKFVAPLCL